MNESPNSRICKNCGEPALQGANLCGRCLAGAILLERAKGEITMNAASRKTVSARNRIHICNLVVAVMVLATISGLLVINSAWWAFDKAQQLDTVSAYQSFLRSHGNSRQAATARARAASLDFSRAMEQPCLEGLREFIFNWPGSHEENLARQEIQRMASEQWRTMGRTNNRISLQRFIRDYPEAKEVNIASARIHELAILEAWEQVRDSDDPEALTAHARQHEGHETAALANERINELCNDFDWVRRQDQLPFYRQYLNSNPSSPHSAAVEKRIIDLEVAEIARGEHGVLPPAAPLQMTGGAEAHVEIQNQTRHTLTVRYSGSQSYRFDLDSGETREVRIAAGPYRVAATVASPGVIPYAGKDTLQGGRYSSKFYIETRRW